MSQSIAFIGVGNMGCPMAENLMKAGKSVKVFDVSKKIGFSHKREMLIGLKSKKVKKLYFSGQLTVPGPGVPPAIVSGKLVANIIKNEGII